MSRSIYVSLLVFLVVCFNSSTFGDSIRANGSISQPQPHLNDTKINILFLSIANDLPEGSAQLYFITTFQGTKTLLESGKPFTKFTNFEAKRCLMMWSTLYAFFKLYDPVAEGDHQRIFWSAREDGVYHSWDEVRWDRITTWQSQ